MIQTPQISRKLVQKGHRKATEYKTELPEAQESGGLTPAQIMVQWQAEGVFGAWKDRDIEDSRAFARELRKKAEQREAGEPKA